MTREGAGFPDDTMPLLSEQELRTHNVRIYRPHTTTKPKPFDWDALTPTCKGCGQKSSSLNRDDLCPRCRPQDPHKEEAQTGQPTTRRSAPRANQTSKSPRRARGAGASATRKNRPARRETRPARVGRPGRVPKPVDAEAVVQAYRGGESIISIAHRLGVARPRVRRIVVEAGEQISPGRQNHARAFDLDQEAVVEAYAGGQSISQICDALAFTNRSRIRAIILAAGIEIRMPRGGNPAGGHGKRVDESAIVAEYKSGDSAPTIAERHGILAKRVRHIVVRHGAELRDDRSTHSGGAPRAYDPNLCLAVERLYVEEQLSRTEVARRLGIAYKTVVTIMERRGVRARQGETGRMDGAADLKAQIARLGVESREIKAWAFREGLIPRIGRGLPSQVAVDAYEAAHGGEE